jgi:phosphatidylglycerophosphate synthase
MNEAVVNVSEPGAEAGWPLARVAGLPAIERNLMALRSVGVGRARLACGEAEFPFLSAHFARRARDARLPEVTVMRLGECRCGANLVLDGRFVHHPDRLRAAMPLPSGVGLQPDGAAAAAGYCEAITTAGGRRRARRAILQSLRKPTDGWFARTVDRSISLAISSALAPFPIHPNAVTIGTLLVGVGAGLLAARGTYAGFAAAGALFLLASILDGVDGEIARMKFQGSAVGQWLDTVCDDLTNAFYLAGVAAGAWRAYGSEWLLAAGIAAVALDVITVSFLYWQLLTRLNARTLLAFEETIHAPALEHPGLPGLVARLQPLMKRDVYAPVFLALALAGAAWLTLPAAALALAITLVFLVRDFARPA